MTPHPGTTQRIRMAEDGYYAGDTDKGMTPPEDSILLSADFAETEKAVLAFMAGGGEEWLRDATAFYEKYSCLFSAEDVERFQDKHPGGYPEMVLHVPQSAGKSVQHTGRVSFREYALHLARNLGKTTAATEVCKELLRESSSQKTLDAIAENSDMTQKFLDGEIAVVDPGTRRVAVCGVGHERDIALMMGLLYGKSPSLQKEFSLKRFGDIEGDCLKLAPCTLPKSREAWQQPSHKPTGVRKQQRAAKKKRRK